MDTPNKLSLRHENNNNGNRAAKIDTDRNGFDKPV